MFRLCDMTHRYKLGGFNIVLDVVSGSIHCVDEVAYDAVGLLENENEADVSKQLKLKYTHVTDDDLAELYHDIERLKQGGKLFMGDIYKNSTGAAREKPLKALCLNVSHACNMKCSYCFAGRGEYGGDTELMSLETGKQAIAFLMDCSGPRRNLDVDFFGGEPLLNWRVVKEIVKYARELERGSGKKFRFTLTTNGLLVSDDVIEFTNREMRNVVLSLDGRPEINDAARKLPDGTGSYASVLPGIRKLVEARRGKEHYIRGTITRDNLDFVGDILHLADIGFTKLSMEPVVAKPGDKYALTAGDLPELCRQYELLAALIIERREEGRGFTFYHYMLDLTGGPCAHKRIAGCGVGLEYLAVTPRGELYPCHQFVGNRDFLMGDIWRGVKNTGLRDEFTARGIYSKDECKMCWARMYCGGGCPANAYNASGSIGGIYELGCGMFKKRIECAIMIKAAEQIPEFKTSS